jgi:dTDP-glucose pyrophosphorylase
MSFRKHLVHCSLSVRELLSVLDQLASDAIVFIVDDNDKLLGSLTDGDLRRGFIKGLDFENSLLEFTQPNPKYVRKDKYDLKDIVYYRKKNYKILPVLNEDDKVVEVINFRKLKSYLPIDAVIMAGGRGERLKPFTDSVPKPLLKVGEKPIIEHNIDRLSSYGIFDMWISIRYLGNQIKDYFGNGSSKYLNINYIEEDSPLGTAGALSMVNGFTHNTVLLMNSDLLTNIDFEDFYLFFETESADMAVACIPYQVNIPYAVMETEAHLITGFVEKPTYTHYSNTGIYLIKKELIDLIPKEMFYQATDLMEELIRQKKKVAAYPMMGYWLDIGKPDDFTKAQEDIKHLNL